ncbi:MAG: acetyl-CoA hydrolase/transferase family protein [Oscillospiraceae bacterium]
MDIHALYENKLTSPEYIAAQIQPGWSCCSDLGTANPPAILSALGARAAEGALTGCTFHTLMDLYPLGVLSPEASKGITPISWFSGSGMRAAINDGHADIMPAYYRDMPSLFQKYVNVDALILTAAPMDKHGNLSLGMVASNVEALLSKAQHIYLEINPHMPRVLSAPTVHISQVTALCENDFALPLIASAKADDVSVCIGEIIANEVPDRATIQLGIGAIPDAVGLALKCKHGLGIHTELFTESMVDLIECGAVTNEHKPIHQRKSVATVTFGSKRIYDFIDDNPTFLLLPVDYVNDPAVIASHPNFISVNSALEVDFFGQVCAESIGTRHFSGSGGQADYVRGAIQSKGGKSFIAFPSTAKGGTVSRIKPILTPGAIVTTGKNDVDNIVTEYGIAALRGKSLSQRVKALISIAHPNFRDELTYAAKKQNILI